MALYYRKRRPLDLGPDREGRAEPRLGPQPRPQPHSAPSEVFDTGRKTIVDRAHVKVERLDTRPMLFSKVFKEFEDGRGQRYDYRYWAERENFFLREFLKKQGEFTHVVQARHLISENEAAKQVLTYDAGITVADWLRVKPRYADTTTLSHPFQRSDAFLRLLRACLVALKQIHDHRIVHCDIKEDNICIPYAPQPFPGPGATIRLEFDKLRLIDFAFSIAHAIPLTQILVIDPDKRVPYQSELLIAALRADRRSGSPNAVQQLDYRVDLFSLGHMAEQISAAGLDSPPGPRGDRALDDIHRLVGRLKACAGARKSGPLPHDKLIADIDGLLVATTGASASLEFTVDGEWTAQEMAQETGRDGGPVGRTPLTPVALPQATPMSVLLAPVPRPVREPSSITKPLLLGLALACAAAGALVHRDAGEAWPPWPSGTQVFAPDKAVPHQQAPLDVQRQSAERIALLLRSDEDQVFQSAFAELTRLNASNEPHARAISESIVAEYGGALTAPGSLARRARVLGRLIWMARAGNPFAAERVAAFERDYDAVKQSVAHSAWWTQGANPRPQEAERWMENGELLAANGDRPAMLDVAFALGHGRAPRSDRARAVEVYLQVITRSGAGDEASTRIRHSAVRGLTATLNFIVGDKDQDAARRLLPALVSRADAGAAETQYYVGLLNECVAQPADLDAAQQWYRKAAADPAWARTAGDKARLLGKWCPGRTT